MSHQRSVVSAAHTNVLNDIWGLLDSDNSNNSEIMSPATSRANSVHPQPAESRRQPSPFSGFGDKRLERPSWQAKNLGKRWTKTKRRRRRKEGSVKQARTLERAWNKSMMNVQLAVFNQGSKQGLAVWAASLSRLKLSQAHKATSAGCINYSKGLFWTGSLGDRHIKWSRLG